MIMNRYQILLLGLSLFASMFTPRSSDVSAAAGSPLEAAKLLCDPVSGAPKSYQGSGACAGNVSIKMDLSALYPGFALTYNNTWNTNRGFGVNVTASDVSYVQLWATTGWIHLGDGSYVSLVKQSTGAYAGRWLAADRSEMTSVGSSPLFFNVKRHCSP